MMRTRIAAGKEAPQGASAEGGAETGGVGGTGPAGGAGGTAGYELFEADPVTWLVHASPDLFPFRICAQTSTGYVNDLPYPEDPDHFLPETNYPGIPRGSGVDLDGLVNNLTPGTEVTFRLVRADVTAVMKAQPGVDESATCSVLLEESNPTTHVDLEPIKVDSLLEDTVRVMVVQGCNQGNTLSEIACGAGHNQAEGNLGWNLLSFSPEATERPSPAFVYAAHASPTLEALQQSGQTLEVDYDAASGRNSISSDLVTDLKDAVVTNFSPSATLAEYAEDSFRLTAKESASSADLLLDASLANVQRVSAPYSDPESPVHRQQRLVAALRGRDDDRPVVAHG